jgi:two-component system alkaline phosphatase synthesis response regulator PhoP
MNLDWNKIPQVKTPSSARLQDQTVSPGRILVVDDDHDIRRLSAEVLMHHGYQVDAAEDGAVAWDALQLKRYDLLVTDNNMPKVSGVELLKKVYAARMALPVIMATGTLPREEFIRYPWLQPAATLLKPYAMEEFLGTVQKVLRVTDGDREQLPPPPDWQGQSSPNGLPL